MKNPKNSNSRVKHQKTSKKANNGQKHQKRAISGMTKKHPKTKKQRKGSNIAVEALQKALKQEKARDALNRLYDDSRPLFGPDDKVEEKKIQRFNIVECATEKSQQEIVGVLKELVNIDKQILHVLHNNAIAAEVADSLNHQCPGTGCFTCLAGGVTTTKIHRQVEPAVMKVVNDGVTDNGPTLKAFLQKRLHWVKTDRGNMKSWWGKLILTAHEHVLYIDQDSEGSLYGRFETGTREKAMELAEKICEGVNEVLGSIEKQEDFQSHRGL